MVKTTAKTKVKRARTKARVGKAGPIRGVSQPLRKGAASRRGKKVVELQKKGPRTSQKTVRVPNTILAWLEAKAQKVDGLSVPAAIVQILERVYESERAKVAYPQKPSA